MPMPLDRPGSDTGMERLLYLVGLVGIFPAAIAVHGIWWVGSGQTASLAAAVYAMKLAFVPFLAVVIALYRRELLQCPMSLRIGLLAAPCFAISLATPLFFQQSLNHYYVTDPAGLALTLVSILVIHRLLVGDVFSIAFVDRACAAFLAVISIYVIGYYILSGWHKINNAPEMHIPMALAFTAFILPSREGYRPPALLLCLVAFACAASQLRENIILCGVLFAVALLRRGLQNGIRDCLPIAGGAVLFIVVVGFFNPLMVVERMMEVAGSMVATGQGAPLPNPSMVATGQGSPFPNPSINQRFVEISLMWREMQQQPLSMLTGMGFGATYENVGGVLTSYPSRVHNGHSTPMVVYFRNGPYGLILFLIIGALAAWHIFSRDLLTFRASLAVLAAYASMLANQYLYWNAQFGLAVALLFYAIGRRPA